MMKEKEAVASHWRFAFMANLNRSNTVVDAGLPRDVSAATVAVESVAMTYPVFAYTCDVDEVFVSRD